MSETLDASDDVADHKLMDERNKLTGRLTKVIYMLTS